MPEKEVTRTCITCGYTDAEWKFPMQNIQFGRAHYRKQCKPCYNIYQLKRKAIRTGTPLIETKPSRQWPYAEET